MLRIGGLTVNFILCSDWPGIEEKVRNVLACRPGREARVRDRLWLHSDMTACECKCKCMEVARLQLNQTESSLSAVTPGTAEASQHRRPLQPPHPTILDHPRRRKSKVATVIFLNSSVEI